MSECDVLAMADAELATEKQEDQLALLTFTHQLWINFHVNGVPCGFQPTEIQSINNERCLDSGVFFLINQHKLKFGLQSLGKMGDLLLYFGLSPSDSKE